MTVERPPSAVLSEAAMFGAFVGVVAMMAVMVAGGSGFLVAGLWGVLFGLAAFAALLILLPKTAAAEVVEDLVAPVTPLAESETGDVVGGAGDAGAATDSDTAAVRSEEPPEIGSPAGAAPDGATSGGAPGTDGGSPRPATLAGPRQGQADDLKMIKGVGPKLEAALNDAGFWHFDQIAGWGEADLDWVDENLTGIRGRAVRDDWVGQAKLLAAGGSTEFSKRVEDGEVY